ESVLLCRELDQGQKQTDRWTGSRKGSLHGAEEPSRVRDRRRCHGRLPSGSREAPFCGRRGRRCSMKQSRFMSLVEAATNVVVGYILAIATQIVVFPWFGIETGLAEHMTIGLAFVGVSLARGYLLRRLFERLRGW